MGHIEEYKQDGINHHSQVTLSKQERYSCFLRGREERMKCLHMCIPGITGTIYPGKHRRGQVGKEPTLSTFQQLRPDQSRNKLAVAQSLLFFPSQVISQLHALRHVKWEGAERVHH